ncbi:hypothetical protein MUP77_05195 [Candidatus Bathyarchaeota archaeon]|nr:hypothetical protein [Candidatus Bathyarchaeota archaeon]
MKIGNYVIPDQRLFPKLYDAAKLIYENYRLEEAEDENAVAKLLGHKTANSGSFNGKIADLRQYGLLEPRNLKASQLTETLTYGEEQDKVDATTTAVLNVPLWKELYSKFGVVLPESNFWVQLQRITGLDPLEAQKHADYVRKAYLDDAGHIKAQSKPQSGGVGVTHGIIDNSMSTINIQAGQFSQTIPFTKDGIEYAKGFLDLLKTRLASNDEKQETKTEG